MKKALLTAASLVLATSAYALSKPPPNVVPAHTAFGFDMLHQLAAKPGANVFISPTSISTALEMTYNGASGQTKAEMARTLHVNGISLDAINRGNQALRTRTMKGDPKVKISIANSLWAQKRYPFLATFMQPIKRFYAAAVENVVFGPPETTQRINTWVEKQTNGKIKNLLKPLNALTRLVLVNAVYFKGQWTDQFQKSSTSSQPFTLHSGSTVQAPLMSRSGQYRYLKGDDFQAIRLPYGSERFAMYVFLPDKANGLPGLIKKASGPALNAWVKQMTPTTVGIKLPRFKAEYSQALNGPLTALGMKQAFSRVSADFRGMTGSKDLYISLVQHKAFVDVNEEGTEAAAATAVVMTLRSAAPPRTRMVVDHPFLCTIRDDKTGEILFLGAIYDPSR